MPGGALPLATHKHTRLSLRVVFFRRVVLATIAASRTDVPEKVPGPYGPDLLVAIVTIGEKDGKVWRECLQIDDEFTDGHGCSVSFSL
jgi:hypothetical protein